MTLLISLVFILGYLAITLEHTFRINKAATAILTGVICWTLYVLSDTDPHLVGTQLNEHLAEIASILFFLLGAMTIVELIDQHDGFDIVVNLIRTTDKQKLIWIVAIITFFLSSVLDNLTTAIVMVSLLKKIITDRNDRLYFVAMVIIAANAGGAWSPIGDVTTTMLWIGGQISSLNIILTLFIPSLVSLLVPLLFISPRVRGKFEKPGPAFRGHGAVQSTQYERNLVFYLGIGALMFVPVFKTYTHLPPYMGILFGLGVLWVVTEMIHHKKPEEDKTYFSVTSALQKIDTPSILFFLGILISIAALSSTGLLSQLSDGLTKVLPDMNMIAIVIGLVSAVVDNVPLVAAAMGMYDLTHFPMDNPFWEFLAYCAGTGGSILIIGSAAGVAAMGMEKIDFFWYFKKISWIALAGYLAGAVTHLLLS